MKSLFPILPVLFLFTQLLQAQINFRPGYIINNDGDTVYGEIDLRPELLMAQSCHFRNQDLTITKDFFPNDLLGYRFIDGKYFISREISGKRVFLEFLIRGKISVFYLRDTLGDHYYLEKEGYEFAELPYEDRIIYKDISPSTYKSWTHIAMLNLYMQDAPSMKDKIKGTGKPTHQNLTRLARSYHQIVCKGIPCIVYGK